MFKIKKKLNPIENYDCYFITKENKNLYGISSGGITLIIVKDKYDNVIKLTDFFIKNKSMYFSFRVVEETNDKDEEGNKIIIDTIIHCKQTGEEISQVETIPDKPNLNRIDEFKSEYFIIKSIKYEGGVYTDIENLTCISGIERFELVNNHLQIDDIGLVFNVVIGRGEELDIRNRGLYFWGNERKGVEYLIGEGDMWK